MSSLAKDDEAEGIGSTTSGKTLRTVVTDSSFRENGGKQFYAVTADEGSTSDVTSKDLLWKLLSAPDKEDEYLEQLFDPCDHWFSLYFGECFPSTSSYFSTAPSTCKISDTSNKKK
mmetsp:Transcript_18378/g.18463  ORF Transcript_18378/g.18463 Transcript_18378/m.18463 type:complete len:116 (+) Transcript_18378:119-466(+)|eukprot:CAMPEP_0182428044 /NCGR_PEP_ID=MMETSP1167-20130531/20978_1 /TAXON_ID=2988 /ORGANISM="Mallomonas Sp, Strain CCMP3275" /LENGTH=115 /DNA_ID=CAMNT_0024610685 /DNA_START=106 /DNA_END=453 /DNA_ORIENTATION=-